MGWTGIYREVPRGTEREGDLALFQSPDEEVGSLYLVLTSSGDTIEAWPEELQATGEERAARVRWAIEHLRQARELLKAAGATKATERVRRAITSAEGARRHALAEPYREERRLRALEDERRRAGR